MEKTVLCIRNQDMRQEYLAELMRESGYEVCLQEKIEGPKIETWDIILLPVVTGEVPFENISGHIRAGQHIFAGTFPRTFQTVCREKRASCHAYMSEEEIAIKNAVAAAEGAIAEAILNGKENLQGGSSLVLGYGRCGSVLADKLRGMGSTVTVYEKDPVRKTQAEVRGFAENCTDGFRAEREKTGFADAADERHGEERYLPGLRRAFEHLRIRSRRGGNILKGAELLYG